MKVIAVLLVTFNISCLLIGILKNPGIPQAIIDSKLKDQLGKGNNIKCTTNINDDLESGNKKQSI